MTHQIDSLAYTNLLRPLPPFEKFTFFLFLLLLSLVSSWIVQLLIILWLAIWTVVYAGISLKVYLRLLSLPLGFYLLSCPALIVNVVSLGQKQTIQWDVYTGGSMAWLYIYLSQSGLHQVTLLLTRTLASTSCLYFLLLTIPFTEILHILRHCRCPPLLTELLLLMYRFIFTLLSIAEEIWLAQNARGGYHNWQRGRQSLAILVGQLLQRSLENYRQVSLSLAARGFNGDIRVWHSYPYKISQRYRVEAICGCGILTFLSIIR